MSTISIQMYVDKNYNRYIQRKHCIAFIDGQEIMSIYPSKDVEGFDVKIRETKQIYKVSDQETIIETVWARNAHREQNAMWLQNVKPAEPIVIDLPTIDEQPAVSSIKVDLSAFDTKPTGMRKWIFDIFVGEITVRFKKYDKFGVVKTEAIELAQKLGSTNIRLVTTNFAD